VDEIETHLKSLGAGNHLDNMKVVRSFPNHYLLSLEKEEFMDLIFLQSHEVAKIVPSETDRRLRVVAQHARGLSAIESRLSGNWNILANLSRLQKSILHDLALPLPAFLLRDVRGSESCWSNGWYLQDGSHRALAYCMMILAGEVNYRCQLAFCATSKTFPS
jgi:hypothetical protein